MIRLAKASRFGLTMCGTKEAGSSWNLDSATNLPDRGEEWFVVSFGDQTKNIGQ